MKITKILIKNFKSINEIEFEVNKNGGSYTAILIGINEVGKSNILKAMSFFNPPQEKFNYHDLKHKKNKNDEYIDLFFDLVFDNKNTYIEFVKKEVINGDLLNFKIKNIQKNIYLKKDEKVFRFEYCYDIEILSKNLFIKTNLEGRIEVSEENDEESSFKELSEDVFEEFFREKIDFVIAKYEPKTSFWKPSEKYLISSEVEINLNKFKDDLNSNIPLKNIFVLAGYDVDESIKESISLISDSSERERLESELGKTLTDYVKKIWKHDITFKVRIEKSGLIEIKVKDDGRENEFYSHEMNSRSDGFKQFLSLILSLSIETENSKRKNELILIDEPENHLHPSGIRDLAKELLKIGRDNFLFVSTHSPFLIDTKNKERHLIIKKESAFTIKKKIEQEEDLQDDEVLSEAFGINVFKDLLKPHNILVEGESDKKILQKAFKIFDNSDYGITNGIGSNIVACASMFNRNNINIVVITDDDKDGKKYKEKIKKIGGVYNENNVLTIRDLVGNIVNEGTIEDCLDKTYVIAQLKVLYKSEFKKDIDLGLSDNTPIIKQIKEFLQQNGDAGQVDLFLEKLKTSISENLNLNRESLSNKFPLLENLLENLIKKIKSIQ